MPRDTEDELRSLKTDVMYLEDRVKKLEDELAALKRVVSSGSVR